MFKMPSSASKQVTHLLTFLKVEQSSSSYICNFSVNNVYQFCRASGLSYIVSYSVDSLHNGVKD